MPELLASSSTAAAHQESRSLLTNPRHHSSGIAAAASAIPTRQYCCCISPSYKFMMIIVFTALPVFLFVFDVILPVAQRRRGGNGDAGISKLKNTTPSIMNDVKNENESHFILLESNHNNITTVDPTTPSPTIRANPNTLPPSHLPTSLPTPPPTSPPPPLPASCHRTCHNHTYPNILIWRELSHAAGLLDRFCVLETLLKMAGYLCARVYAPRPRFVLTPSHNFGQAVDPNVPWSEFVLYHYWDDAVSKSTESPLVDWHNATDPYDAPRVFSLHGQFPKYPYYLSDQPWKINHYFQEAEKYVWDVQQPNFRRLDFQNSINNNNNNNNNNNTTNMKKRQRPRKLPFIWEITTEFYGWSGSLQAFYEKRKKQEEEEEEDALKSAATTATPTATTRRNWTSLPAYCSYVQQSSPYHLAAMRDQVKARIQDTKSLSSSSSSSSLSGPSRLLLGELRIRRNDATLECDTSLKRLRSFLNCSLWDAWTTLLSKPATSSTTWHVKVLLLSDERNNTYRQEVGHILQDLAAQAQTAITATTTATSDTSTTTPTASSLIVTLVDIDLLVHQMLEEQAKQQGFPAWRRNNYYAFQVSSEALMTLPIQFRLQQRRSFMCPACTDVKQQLVQSGVLPSKPS